MSRSALLALALPAALSAATREEALNQAVGRAAKVEERFARTWTFYAIAEEWAHTDPARAADLADRLKAWTARRDLLSVVMFAWGRRDPRAAADWGLKFQERTQGDLATRNTALHHAVVGMVQKDPKLADELIWKHLAEEGWGNLPRTAPMEAARELAKSDPQAALTMAEAIKNHEGCRVDALRAVLREWAAKDPKAAQAALAGRSEKEFVKAFPRDLAEGWAAKDPKAAADYAAKIQDAYTRIMALAAVARETAKADPKGAADLCAAFAALNVGHRHEQNARLGKLVREIGEAFGRKDLQAAVQWAAALPDKPGGLQANAIDGVAAAWAATDPKAALDYYAKAGGGTGDALPALARALAKRAAPAALELVGQAKRLVLKSHIIHEVAIELAGRDPEAAARLAETWAGVTDYYSYRAAAASAAAAAWAGKDPKQAAAWAAKLEPTRDRLDALRAVAAAWAKRSPDVAFAWANALPCPQEAAHALVGTAQGLRPEAP
ncbi:MAG: hypothetical protein FJ290_09975 [Planctomycetes bacterium]|nr:hypothetical protein [Planctomycetota bacterium]